MFEQWQLDLLDEARVARLGTVAADGRPHLVPVCFAFVDDTFVIAIDEKPKRGIRLARLRNIERDRRVSLLIDRYDDDWTRLAWIRVDGTAGVLDRGGRLPASLAALRARYPQYRQMALEDLPLIVIAPEHIAAWRWQDAQVESRPTEG